MPGRMEWRRACAAEYSGRYSISSGRGPTTLMSPRSTLNSSGSSSRLAARSWRPNSVGCGSSGGTSRCLWDDVLGVAGLVDAVTFLGEVVAPVVVEVAVAGDGAQFEDGLCAG